MMIQKNNCHVLIVIIDNQFLNNSKLGGRYCSIYTYWLCNGGRGGGGVINYVISEALIPVPHSENTNVHMLHKSPLM